MQNYSSVLLYPRKTKYRAHGNETLKDSVPFVRHSEWIAHQIAGKNNPRHPLEPASNLKGTVYISLCKQGFRQKLNSRLQTISKLAI
jgi:hypothetical protein